MCGSNPETLFECHLSLIYSAGRPVINQRRRGETSSMFLLKNCALCCRVRVTLARWTNPPSCRGPLTFCRNRKVREMIKVFCKNDIG